MHKTPEEWKEVYRSRQGYFDHDRNPKRPHVRLTSGKHSTGFYNSEVVFEQPVLVSMACSDMIENLRRAGFDLQMVDRVIGPAMGGIPVTDELARQIEWRTGRPCYRSIAEKENGVKAFKRSPPKAGERVLTVDDVCSTTKSIEETVDAALPYGVTILPYVMLLVNRSGRRDSKGKVLLPLIDDPMPMWDEPDCELCKKGSEVMSAKGNWDKLNAVY